MQFAFKRDSEGRETIHIADVAIARVTDHPEGFEWLASPPAGVTAEHVREAAVKADEAGFFWGIDGIESHRADEVAVVVPVHAPSTLTCWPYKTTTSTTLSLTTEDER
jgi:hypothetical protein